VQFLVEMDEDVRSFFDQLHVKAKEAARAAKARGEKAPLPSLKGMMGDALRQWAEAHPEWSGK
jgi:hypothetical protein